jgi:hypothetical protein
MDPTASLVVAADRKKTLSLPGIEGYPEKSIITILSWISKPLFHL